ncbi:MAG: Asp-tRNA(Asn)/Glu-tRNA(Gln) amidotransferase subunit GatB [Deltaproteobacteria bacterium]|nr:Asp-tRNA(Asn)/Glu-tRNA(Gln) amidotransferase subunit GatB [Deltaproteobacteria bacterium]
MEYEVIICFEVHAELGTKTKLFCGCRNDPAAPPNANICPVCTGQPGALPVLNRRAVEYCVRAGLALNCDINAGSRFARKNYFYPDLPKGYQISQYERPFCENGWLEIEGDDGRPYPVGIRRIHLEEDAGKLVHGAGSFETADFSLVDFNRASVPLIEIVGDHTRNPLRSVREARAFLEKMQQILRYIGVSDCSMEKGQLRCDVNVSIRPPGEPGFGNRSEIKNMASFRFVTEALEHEIERQAGLLRSGRPVVQETRLFDEERRITLPMRSKEDAPDYRYFPDPDLVEIQLDRETVEAVGRAMPELPDQRVSRLVRDLDIPREEAAVLTRDRAVSDFFDRCTPLCEDATRLSRWIIKDLFRLLNQAGLDMPGCPIGPEPFSRLVNLVAGGEVTEQAARSVLDDMFRTGKPPDVLVEEKGLRSIRDEKTLARMVDEVLAEHPGVAAEIRGGRVEPINFLVGMVMKKSSGRADAARVRELLKERL